MDVHHVGARVAAPLQPQGRTVAPGSTVRLRDMDGEHEYTAIRSSATASPCT